MLLIVGGGIALFFGCAPWGHEQITFTDHMLDALDVAAGGILLALGKQP